MEASRSAAAALAAFRADRYTWYAARAEATITEASKVHIRATESTAGSNMYEALSSSDRRFESSTSSESTPILSTRQKNKTITSEKLQSKLNSSWPLRWNGLAIDVKRRMTSENAKPMMSCIVEPGRMSTQKPTRNNYKGRNIAGLQEVAHLSVWDGAAEGQRTFLKISTSSHQNIDGV